MNQNEKPLLQIIAPHLRGSGMSCIVRGGGQGMVMTFRVLFVKKIKLFKHVRTKIVMEHVHLFILSTREQKICTNYEETPRKTHRTPVCHFWDNDPAMK